MYSRKERNELLLKVANRGAYLHQPNPFTFLMTRPRKIAIRPRNNSKRWYEIHIIDKVVDWNRRHRHPIFVERRDEDLLLQCIYIYLPVRSRPSINAASRTRENPPEKRREKKFTSSFFSQQLGQPLSFNDLSPHTKNIERKKKGARENKKSTRDLKSDLSSGRRNLTMSHHQFSMEKALK